MDVIKDKEKLTSREAYMRESGEVEARNVQSRKDMGAEERALNKPWETEQYPVEKQIITALTDRKLPASLKQSMRAKGLLGWGID